MNLNNYTIWKDKKGYPCIWVGGKSIKVHVAIWELNNGEKPKGHDIHHKDFDKGNYSLENLELLSFSDHKKIHAGWDRDENGRLNLKPCKECKRLLAVDKFYQRKGLTPSNRCIECSSAYFKEKSHADGFKSKRKTYMENYYAKNKKEKWGIKCES